jgi:hypothetical protein
MVTGSFHPGALTAGTEETNWTYLCADHSASYTTSGSPGYTMNVVNDYAIMVGVKHAVAELTFDNGPENKITIQLNKKLSLWRRLCYSALGFKYRTL